MGGTTNAIHLSVLSFMKRTVFIFTFLLQFKLGPLRCDPKTKTSMYNQTEKCLFYGCTADEVKIYIKAMKLLFNIV